jgi:oligoribonuclease
MTARTILFWLDFEATSLDVRKGHGELLEYAVVFTDLELNELDAYESIIPHSWDRVNSLLSPKAREMHIANGLLSELRDADQMVTLAKGEAVVKGIEEMLLKRMRQFMAEEPTIFVIAGSSIWYDRNALKEHMPKLDKALHYRLLDVSVYKVGFPSIFGSETSTAHRAMADIRESIKKHAKMREIVAVYKQPGQPTSFNVNDD